MRCELGTRGQGSRTGQVLILTVPEKADHHGLAELSRWIYVRLGTRPYDPAEAAAVQEREREGARVASRTWTTRELEFVGVCWFEGSSYAASRRSARPLERDTRFRRGVNA